MISVKQLINAQDRELLDAYRQATILLMESAAKHSVAGETADLEAFRRTLVDLARGISENSSGKDILNAARAGESALGDYGRQTTQFIKAQKTELQAMVAMLTRTMSAISTSGDKSILHLQDIERKLAKAAQIEDLRTLKSNMSECLDTVRAECIRQKQESAQTLENLRAGFLQPENPTPSVPGAPDPTTGLPRRQDAEAELRKVASSGKRAFAAIFVVDRIPAITSRFGQALGDKALLVFLERLTAAKGPADQLFRWAGSSFFAILDRPCDLATTNRELNQHFLQKCNRAFDLGSRSVLLPISASWVVIEAWGQPVSKVVAAIDAFVAKTVVTI